MPAGVEVLSSIEVSRGGARGVEVSGAACFVDQPLTLTRISSTRWRITFTRPVVNNPWLTAPINWVVHDSLGIAPDLVVSAVTPENVANPTFVDLDADEQRTGIDYQVEAYILEAAP